MDRARAAGAVVHNEVKKGYGACVYRCLREAVKYDDTELIVLCEGDMTFRAADLAKFLAYLPHAEIVNGTRIVEQLRAYDTQLSTFMSTATSLSASSWRSNILARAHSPM
jgi:hypothetical protein